MCSLKQSKCCSSYSCGCICSATEPQQRILTAAAKNTGKTWSQLYGLGGSLFIYYAIPGRNRRWRNFYRSFVRPNDLCFDIGAHLGNRTRALAAIGARVLALEPQSSCQPILRQLYGRHPRIILSQKAVAAQKGRATMLLSPRNPSVSSLSAAWVRRVAATDGFLQVRWDQEESVEVTTLDALIDEHGMPKYCKLDIEGYELEALKGLSQPIKSLSFEYVPAAMDIALGCVKYLANLGRYEFNFIESEVPTFAASNWLSAMEMADRLSALPSGARAGEIYARLRETL